MSVSTGEVSTGTCIFIRPESVPLGAECISTRTDWGHAYLDEKCTLKPSDSDVKLNGKFDMCIPLTL